MAKKTWTKAREEANRFRQAEADIQRRMADKSDAERAAYQRRLAEKDAAIERTRSEAASRAKPSTPKVKPAAARKPMFEGLRGGLKKAAGKVGQAASAVSNKVRAAAEAVFPSAKKVPWIKQRGLENARSAEWKAWRSNVGRGMKSAATKPAGEVLRGAFPRTAAAMARAGNALKAAGSGIGRAGGAAALGGLILDTGMGVIDAIAAGQDSEAYNQYLSGLHQTEQQIYDVLQQSMGDDPNKREYVRMFNEVMKQLNASDPRGATGNNFYDQQNKVLKMQYALAAAKGMMEPDNEAVKRAQEVFGSKLTQHQSVDPTAFDPVSSVRKAIREGGLSGRAFRTRDFIHEHLPVLSMADLMPTYMGSGEMGELQEGLTGAGGAPKGVPTTGDEGRWSQLAGAIKSSAKPKVEGAPKQPAQTARDLGEKVVQSGAGGVKAGPAAGTDFQSRLSAYLVDQGLEPSGKIPVGQENAYAMSKYLAGGPIYDADVRGFRPAQAADVGYRVIRGLRDTKREKEVDARNREHRAAYDARYNKAIDEFIRLEVAKEGTRTAQWNALAQSGGGVPMQTKFTPGKPVQMTVGSTGINTASAGIKQPSFGDLARERKQAIEEGNVPRQKFFEAEMQKRMGTPAQATPAPGTVSGAETAAGLKQQPGMFNRMLSAVGFGPAVPVPGVPEAAPLPQSPAVTSAADYWRQRAEEA